MEAYSYCESAEKLWETLHKVYGNSSNLNRVYELKKPINNMSQEEMKFNDHFGRFNSRWAELDSLRPSTTDSNILNERREQDKVFGLLLTLNLIYIDLIKHILGPEKLLTLDEVCSQVQMEHGSHGLFEENESISLANQSATSFQSHMAHYKKYEGRGPGVTTENEMDIPRRSVETFTHTSNLTSSDEPCPWRYKELA